VADLKIGQYRPKSTVRSDCATGRIGN